MERNENRQLDALTLLRIMGAPSLGNTEIPDLSEEALIRLFPLAIENRVPLAFLESALKISEDSAVLRQHKEAYETKSNEFWSLVDNLSKIFSQVSNQYAIFKTFKPFPFVTVDVDVIFFNPKDVLKARRALQHKNYKFLEAGSHSISMLDVKRDLVVDLHSEISVSQMVYIKKNLLQKFITEVEIHGIQTNVFEPPAALALVLAHSLYKEQMFTLADYYIVINEMLKMTADQRRTLTELTQKLNINLSLKLALSLASYITLYTFKRETPAIYDTMKMIQNNEIENNIAYIALNQFMKKPNMPFKYPLLCFILALTEKALKDPLMRSTLPQQLALIVTNTSKFTTAALDHLKRKSY